MRAFHDNPYALRLKHIKNKMSNLLGQQLLDLRSSREHLSQSSQFGKANHPAIGNITDVYLPQKVNIVALEMFIKDLLFQ